jgi:restriction endonuclease Mrr
MPDDGWCTNKCHFLMVSGTEHVDDEGFFPVFGIDCDVEVLCWGGDDVENSTIEVFCSECAAAMHRCRVEREQAEEADYEQRLRAERQKRAVEGPKRRMSSEFWSNLTELEFEVQCAELFKGLCFGAETTPRTNDGGIDILLARDGKRGAAQCKAWGKPCGVRELREFYGVVCAGKLEFGYFISKSGFTERAAALLQEMANVQGWTIEDLVARAGRRAQ